MKRASKITCVVISIVMLVTLFGCGSKTDNGSNPSNAEKVQPVNLTMWDYMASDEDSRVLRPILEDFKKQNPNIIIERDFVGVEDYKIKLKTAISGNAAPDIFITWGGGFSKPFVDADKVLQLDDYLSEETKAKTIPTYEETMTYDGKLYGLPFDAWVGVLFCNKELFEKYKVKYPETFDELLAAAKTFRANGIGPMAVGVNEKWTASMYQNIIALRTAGADNCMNALTGTGRFDTPEITDSINKLSELVKANAFIDGALGLNYDEIRSIFKQGQAAMFVDGSWFAGECELAESPVKGKIVAKKFPMINGGKGTATEYLGGSIDSFMISSKTKNPKEAVKALEYICTNYSTKGYYAGLGLPVFKDDFDNSKLDRLTQEVKTISSDATKFQLAWDTVLSEEDTQILLDSVADVFSNKITADKFGKTMQAINDKKK